MVSFKSAPWEGKGVVYYVKDTVLKRPAMVPVFLFYAVALPVIGLYFHYSDKSEWVKASRFRPTYVVYRDDDPKVEKILKYDENGNQVHLTPAKH